MTQKENLLKFYAESMREKAEEHRKTLAKPKFEKLDRVLFELFRVREKQGVCLIGELIREKAKFFMK